MTALGAHMTGSASRGIALDVQFTVNPGDRLALIGPNGAGKTSVLRLIAGLDTPRPGSNISVGGAPLTQLPAWKRRIPLVFPEPHLPPTQRVGTVLNHIARNHHGRTAATQHVAAILDSTGLTSLVDRRTSTLSSGQATRVAIACALTAPHDALLLDEPFSALDTATAAEIRAAVRALMAAQNTPLVFTTHHPLDVLTLATHVAVIEEGTLIQCGTVEDVSRTPRSAFAARFLGVNIVAAQRDHTTPDQLVLSSGHILASVAEGRDASTEPSHVWVSFRPSDITVSRGSTATSQRNQWAAQVDHIEILGSLARLHLTGPLPVWADITVDALLDLRITEGETVTAGLKATSLSIYARGDTHE